MRFAKMQGVGNDFVVVSADNIADTNYSQMALRLCERRFSVGADGLLVIGRPVCPDSAFSFRMFNPDGTEDMCGNGLRCAALYAHRSGLIRIEEFLVDTKDGQRVCELLSTEDTKGVARIDMGEPKFTPAELPMEVTRGDFINQPLTVIDRTFRTTVVNTGSTHSIVFLENPQNEVEFLKYGLAFENHPLFPERTSVLFTVQTAPKEFNVRIWERGAGETLGCGTGACAAAVAAILTYRASQEDIISIVSRGGELLIEWPQTIWMTGPAELTFEGVIE
jgi:diaminopimelate epimerase